ncbi:Glycosyl hydrolases family 2, TIM barrel domain [Ekhidna lutea]|uniref:Glycosyl hydrolases family 2, TIM barrel domain n=1 Tax=Ekhidna lutea TaxID=447679 RepID=A0A239LXM2_EKHLU|nr:Glycosyl hydrolases family 2, TIM barrel domain [Ekhidna lutea]
MIAIVACSSSPDNQSVGTTNKVEIREVGNGYKLFRNGEPYEFNGAGLNGDISSLAAHGGNSIRTWSENSEILDLAYQHNMTVYMCFYIQPERHGMDYNNQDQKEKQFERVKKFVLENKDHPALLAWCIGNELNLNYTDPSVYDEVNRISEWIQEVDPNHPTTTAISSVDPGVVKEIKERAPSLDFLSVQVYGDLFVLQDLLRESNWSKPYMVTEWGAIGHWEMPSTEWGAPIEQNSTQKATNYLNGYNKSIKPFGDKCLGNYVFLWGQKQERTPTWYGLFLEEGEETEVIDVMHYIWNDEWPVNRTPRLDSMLLDDKEAKENVYLLAGNSYRANVFTQDFDGDSLTYKWVVMKESTEAKEGGDHEEVPEKLGDIESAQQPSIMITAPEESGAYRLFVYVFDRNGHAAHANIPFYVKDH